MGKRTREEAITHPHAYDPRSYAESDEAQNVGVLEFHTIYSIQKASPSYAGILKKKKVSAEMEKKKVKQYSL